MAHRVASISPGSLPRAALARRRAPHLMATHLSSRRPHIHVGHLARKSPAPACYLLLISPPGHGRGCCPPLHGPAARTARRDSGATRLQKHRPPSSHAQLCSLTWACPRFSGVASLLHYIIFLVLATVILLSIVSSLSISASRHSTLWSAKCRALSRLPRLEPSRKRTVAARCCFGARSVRPASFAIK